MYFLNLGSERVRILEDEPPNHMAHVDLFHLHVGMTLLQFPSARHNRVDGPSKW